MNTNNKEQLKNVKLQIVKINILGVPGAILLGLGLYGMFAANGNAFHPLLNDMNVVYGCLAVGGAIEVWQFIMVLPLLKKLLQIPQW